MLYCHEFQLFHCIIWVKQRYHKEGNLNGAVDFIPRSANQTGSVKQLTGRARFVESQEFPLARQVACTVAFTNHVALLAAAASERRSGTSSDSGLPADRADESRFSSGRLLRAYRLHK